MLAYTLVIVSLPFSAKTSEINFTRIGLSQGLPHLFVLQTTQQRNGYIWFATELGAVQYDGKNFVEFKYGLTNDHGLSNNFVNYLFEDSQDNIWLGTDFGLNKLDKAGHLHHFTPDSNKPGTISGNWVNYIYEDERGNLLVGTDVGLEYFNTRTESFTRLNIDPSITNASDLVIKEIVNFKNVTLVASSHGLLTIENNVLIPFKNTIRELTTQEHDFLTGPISVIKIASNKDLILGGRSSGVMIINQATLATQFLTHDRGEANSIASNIITDIEQLSDGTIWIAHFESGISVYSPSENRIIRLSYDKSNSNSLPADRITDLFVDASGLMWISTTNGLAQYSLLTKYSQIYSSDVLSSEVVKDTALDNQGDVWLTAGSSFNRLKLTTNQINQFTPSDYIHELSSDRIIRNISVASPTQVWGSTGEHLLWFNSERDELRAFRFDDIAFKESGLRYFDTLLANDNDTIWLSGNSNFGIGHFNPKTGVLKQYLTRKDSPYRQGGNFTSTIAKDHNGNLWLATSDGVFAINPQTGAEFHFRLSDGQAFLRAMDLTIDNHNNIWVATQGSGLVRLITQGSDLSRTIKEFVSLDNKLAQRDFNAVAFAKDKVWFTSLQQVYQYDITQGVFKQFNNFFRLDEFTFANNSLTLQENNLLLGSSQGLLRINVKKRQTNTFSPNIVVTKFSAGQRSIVPLYREGPYVFDSDENTVRFEFSALDFTKVNDNRFRYKLTGAQDQWTQPSTNTHIAFHHLQPGDYTFTLQGTNSDGIWSENQASIHFVIQRPLWWYSMLSLLLLAVVMGFLYFITRQQKIVELKRHATVDHLTGLNNRYQFVSRVTNFIAKYEEGLAVVYIDIDNFRDINDTKGHNVGDQLILLAAKLLKKHIRSSDTIARIGGDEFALAIVNFDNKEHLKDIVSRLHTIMNDKINLNGDFLNTSASFGVAVYPDDGENAQQLLQSADTALYAAKKNGRNQVYFCNEQLSIEIKENLAIRAQLLTALEKDEFELYYQPKVCTQRKIILGFEALIRWHNSELGFVPPDRFIAEAESNGTIIDIGKWVLTSACNQALKWHQQGLLKETVAVNVSAVQLLHNEFVDTVKSVLKTTGLPANKLELEITETSLLKDLTQAEKVIYQLRDIGVSIALDDFGTGYSSMSYFTKLNFDTIKIDRSFINELERDDRAAVLINNVFSLAHGLKMRVVSEGVEHFHQLSFLVERGPGYIQGYYFSPPIPAPKVEEFILNSAQLRDKFTAPLKQSTQSQIG